MVMSMTAKCNCGWKFEDEDEKKVLVAIARHQSNHLNSWVEVEEEHVS